MFEKKTVAISCFCRLVMILISTCCMGCNHGSEALVQSKQVELQQRESSETLAISSTSNSSRTPAKIEEGWQRHTSTFFTFDCPEHWLIEEAKESRGSDAMQVICNESGPDFFTANLSVRSVYVHDSKDLAEWERDDKQVQEIDSRKFKFALKREPFLIPPSYPIKIDQRSYMHYAEGKKRLFLIQITCGSKNTKDLKIATKIAKSLKISFPEVQLQSPKAKSEFQSGWRHENGLDEKVDHKAAKNAYQRAVKHGSLLAELALASGSISREEIRQTFAEEQYARCRKLLNTAVVLADSGNREAQTLVGNCYLFGHGVSANREVAKHWLTKASDHGCPVAMVSLAQLLFKDPAGYAAAIPILRRAIDLQNPHAEFWLGAAYCHEKGVEKSDQKGLKWIMSAVEKGVDSATTELANRHFKRGEDGHADFDKAFKWYIHGTKKGILHCMSGFAHMVWKKQEFMPAMTDKEVERAFADIEKEIANCASSEFAYAAVLQDLGGISENKQQSDRYIKKAGILLSKYARKKSPDAWYELMKLYQTINEINPDSVDGKIPYCRMRAAELGHEEARRQFDEIEKHLNEKTRAHLQSVEWEKAALRKQESVGGFIAPEWAYQRTPTVKEFREKGRVPLDDDDVLFSTNTSNPSSLEINRRLK